MIKDLSGNTAIENNIGIKKIDNHIIYFNHEDEFLFQWIKGLESSEKFVTDLIKKNVTEGMTAVNIGANVGYYTLVLARQVGENGNVYSFEPFSDTVKNLKRTVKENGYNNVKIIPKAVTNKTGIDKMTVTPSCAHNIITPMDGNLEKIEIDVTTLDDFFADKNPKVDFIMMDAEGSEPYIFDGIKKLVENNPDLEIITEYNAFPLGIVGTSGEDFYKKIKNYGFYIYNIDELTHKVVPITKYELLTRYPDEGMETRLTNLYLTKNPNKNFDD